MNSKTLETELAKSKERMMEAWQELGAGNTKPFQALSPNEAEWVATAIIKGGTVKEAKALKKGWDAQEKGGHRMMMKGHPLDYRASVYGDWEAEVNKQRLIRTVCLEAKRYDIGMVLCDESMRWPQIVEHHSIHNEDIEGLRWAVSNGDSPDWKEIGDNIARNSSPEFGKKVLSEFGKKIPPHQRDMLYCKTGQASKLGKTEWAEPETLIKWAMFGKDKATIKKAFELAKGKEPRLDATQNGINNWEIVGQYIKPDREWLRAAIREGRVDVAKAMTKSNPELSPEGSELSSFVYLLPEVMADRGGRDENGMKPEEKKRSRETFIWLWDKTKKSLTEDTKKATASHGGLIKLGAHLGWDLAEELLGQGISGNPVEVMAYKDKLMAKPQTPKVKAELKAFGKFEKAAMKAEANRCKAGVQEQVERIDAEIEKLTKRKTDLAKAAGIEIG
jgi:hypothetical protein